MIVLKRAQFLGLNSGDILSTRGANRYQAVLAAARMARRLNEQKIAEFEAEPDAERTVEAHKVTSMALEMLLKDEIQFHMPESAQEEARPV